jgi:nucleotide-binding universal stress UspA family protein
MKILVCTDGSPECRKAMEQTARIAAGCGVAEVAVIHVYDNSLLMPTSLGARGITGEEYRLFLDSYKKEGRDILEDAEGFFASRGIRVKTILKGGHPVQTIAKVAAEQGYDLLVVGSRGLGGLKRLFLGSVSNALLQEAKTSVLVVK